MLWSDIRKIYLNQWLIIEALEAHTTPNHRRELEKITVIEMCDDGGTAMNRYRDLHIKYPAREFYFVHTSREELDIRERQWVGIRRNNHRQAAVGQGEAQRGRGAEERRSSERQICPTDNMSLSA